MEKSSSTRSPTPQESDEIYQAWDVQLNEQSCWKYKIINKYVYLYYTFIITSIRCLKDSLFADTFIEAIRERFSLVIQRILALCKRTPL